MIEIDLQDHLQMLSNWYKCPFIISTVALFRCKLFSPIIFPVLQRSRTVLFLIPTPALYRSLLYPNVPKYTHLSPSSPGVPGVQFDAKVDLSGASFVFRFNTGTKVL